MSYGHDHHGSMSNGNMNMNNDDMVMMRMSFYWGKDSIVLFRGWPNHSLGMYILCLLVVFFLSAAVEVFSLSPLTIKPNKGPFLGALGRATVHGLRMAVAYLVMLSVMSFNVGVFIVAVVGHAVGFFLAKFYAFSVASRAAAADHQATSGISAKV